MIDYKKDLLTMDKASEFLNLPPFMIGHAVIDEHIQCGVTARNWRGNAVPSRDDIPRGPKGHVWNSPGITKIHDKDRKDFEWIISLEGTDVSYRIRTAWAVRFWFLQYTDAYRLFAEEKDGIDVSFLIPEDGAYLHRHNPDRYPEPEFTFFVDEKQPNRHITVDDLLFLRTELEKYRDEVATANEKPMEQRERKTYQHIVGALMEYIEGDTPQTEKHPSFKGQTNFIEYLSKHYAGYFGMSERTLKEKIPKAKEALKKT
jgi:hypothetical protein